MKMFALLFYFDESSFPLDHGISRHTARISQYFMACELKKNLIDESGLA
jgi:hypothetical protein